MAEVIVSPDAKETIITLGDGTIVSATISQETLSVVSEKSDPLVVELNSGPRGQPGSAILVGQNYPLMSQGSIGDIFLSTGGVNVGAVFKKTETAWVEEGNVRGPAGGIESVNGDFGPGVILDKEDVGLEFADNTADVDKPISIATQAALDTKAVDADVVHKAGIETVTGAKTFSVAPVVPDASFAIVKVSGLQTALDAKEPTIAAGTTAQYWRGDKAWATLDKAAVGLANVDNTTDASKPVSTATQSALDLKANLASPTFTGTVAGITAAMVGLGNVVNAAQVELTGAQTIAGIKTFSSSPVVPDSSWTIAKTTGLQAALDAKEATLAAGTTAQYYRGDKSWQTLDKAAVGLANVTNAAQVELSGAQTIAGIKTFSSAPVVPDASFTIAKTSGLQSALDLKAPLASPTFTGTVSGISKSMVGLANVDNTSDAAKPVSTAQQTALNLKVNLAGTETITGLKTFSAGLSASAATLTGTLTITPVGNAGIEMGRTDNVASSNFIDFHTGTTGSNDYDARILVSGGTASAGQANMTIYAGSGLGIIGVLTANNGISSSGTITGGTFSGSGASLTSLNATQLTTGDVPDAQLGNAVVRVNHGATAGTARPAGATYVQWFGSVSPTNATNNDEWVNTA